MDASTFQHTERALLDQRGFVGNALSMGYAMNIELKAIQRNVKTVQVRHIHQEAVCAIR